MSGDRVVFNNLERALSTDVNDLQAVGTRVLSEIMGGLGTEQFTVTGSQPSQANLNYCLGLTVNGLVGADTIAVLPGQLIQVASGALPPPAPGPLDSNWRIGELRVAQFVPTPVPGANTWYLLEAQCVETIVSTQMRDIFNPGTQTFVPTLVTKRVDRGIQFQLTAGGSNIPALTGPPWVPIAGIFRPAGGGIVNPADIIDLRRRPSSLAYAGGETFPRDVLIKHRLDTTAVPGGPVSLEITLDVEAQIAGQRAFFRGTIDPTSAAYKDPTTVMTGPGFFYLYMFEWPAAVGGSKPGLPGRTNTTDENQRGIVVLSHILPDSGGVVNMPAPYGVTAGSLTTGRWVLVGVLQTNVAATSFEPQRTDGVNGQRFADGANLLGVNIAAPIATQAADLQTVFPHGVDALHTHATWNAGGDGRQIEFAVAGGAYRTIIGGAADLSLAGTWDSEIRPGIYVLNLGGTVWGANFAVRCNGYKLKQFAP